MFKKMRREKGERYVICANNDPLGEKIVIFQDDLSHMEEAMLYWAAAEAQSRFNKNCGRGVNLLVTGCRSKCVSVMHHFPPLHLIYFL